MALPLADTSSPASGIITVLFIIAVCMAGYFAPSIVGRNKRNFRAIFFMNLALGWTVLGWFVAMIWALTVDSQQANVAVHQPVRVMTKDKPDTFKSATFMYVAIAAVTLAVIIFAATNIIQHPNGTVNQTAPNETPVQMQEVDVRAAASRTKMLEKQHNLSGWVLKDKYTVIPKNKAG